MKDDLRFSPQKDITAYELALLLGLKMRLITRDSFERLPPELSRHFKESGAAE
jgi:hypothetical protein